MIPSKVYFWFIRVVRSFFRFDQFDIHFDLIDTASKLEGSKGIPKKNIVRLNGLPLINYTISAGLKSKYLNKVVVSSDDDEILKISKKTGCSRC